MNTDFTYYCNNYICNCAIKWLSLIYYYDDGIKVGIRATFADISTEYKLLL